MNMRRRLRRWGAGLVCATALALALGCSDNNNSKNGDTPANLGTATVTGLVTGSGGLAGVAVAAGGATTTTDDNGFYILEEAEIPATGRLVITYEKAGYATYQRSIPAEAGGTYAVPAALTLYDINELAIDPATAQVLDGKDATQQIQVRLELDADSFAGAAAGDVRVSVAVGDPSTEEGRAVFPGDYMAASSDGGTPDTPLESIAFSEVTIVDAAGAELRELAKPATLTLRLPEKFQSTGEQAGTYVPGDPVKGFIPWWSYDETSATWVREDADPATAVVDDAAVLNMDLDGDGTLDGLYAMARLDHLSWWNVDRPLSTHACLCVTVVDGSDPPQVLPTIRVSAVGVTYDGTSQPTSADANGRACVNVKKSDPVTADEDRQRVRIRAEAGSVYSYYDVTNDAEGFVGAFEIFTPTTQGSTLDGAISPGECVELANNLVVDLSGNIRGTVTYENSSEPVVGLRIFSDFGETQVTDAQGYFEMDAPVGVDVVLSAVGLVSQSVRVSEAGVPVTVNFQFPNQNPQIRSFTQTPDTSPVDLGADVTFAATAEDPDGDPLTFSWTASAGKPLEAAGSSFGWTAPAEPQTVQVTVTVRDDRGGQATQTRQVVVGGTSGGTSLRIVVQDNPASGQPVPGVYVILYRADNVTVERTIQTDDKGIADFGDIGRERASITIAGEEGDASMVFRRLDSFMDVPVAEAVYYVGAGVPPCTDAPAIDVALDDTSGVAAARLGPFVGLYDTIAPIGFSNVTVCPQYRQAEDNGLTLLVQAFSDFFATFSAYGFRELKDAEVADGASYTVKLAFQPATVTWDTSPQSHETEVEFVGVRQGVEYQLGRSLDMADGKTDGQGSLLLATDFPVDNHWVVAHAVEGEYLTHLSTEKKYAPIAASVTVPIPDYVINTFRFDGAAFEWLVTGKSPRDLMVLVAEAWIYGDGTSGFTMSQVEWNVVMNGDASGWTVPDLPEPVKGWIDFANLPPEGGEATLSAVDMDSITGLDSAWEMLIRGVDPEAAANEIFEGSQLILLGNPTQTAARQVAREPAAAVRALDALEGLQRR